MLTGSPSSHQVVIFGGQSVKATKDLRHEARSESIRLRIEINSPAAGNGGADGPGTGDIGLSNRPQAGDAPGDAVNGSRSGGEGGTAHYQAPTYDVGGGWVQEAMGSARVMPGAVLLPNGVVILLNGAKEGLAGDSASGGGSKAFHPNFYAEMYEPYAPLGQRWTTLSR